MPDTTNRDPSVPLSDDERAAAQRAYDTRVAAISGFPAPYYGDTAANTPAYKRHLNQYLAGEAGGTSDHNGISTPETDQNPVAGNTSIANPPPEPEPEPEKPKQSAPPAPPAS